MAHAVFTKKGDMGIGTLIIFIALLLVAAVAAGVLIQTAGSLQERALTTGDQAKGQIATNVRVVEVSATSGQDGTLEEFEQIVKLSPGSNAIKLDQVLFTMNTYDATASMTYRGTTGTHENNFTNGFYTLAINETLGTVTNAANYTLVEDYDLDGNEDHVYLDGSGMLNFVWSNDGTPVEQVLLASSLNCSGGVHAITGGTISGNDYVSEIVASGSCGGGSTAGATITLVPKRAGEGVFTVEYLQRGTNPIDGNLQTGDVIKIYYESPREVNEDEEVRINFIPKIGTPTLTQFITPEVISTQRVYLYP